MSFFAQGAEHVGILHRTGTQEKNKQPGAFFPCKVFNVVDVKFYL